MIFIISIIIIFIRTVLLDVVSFVINIVVQVCAHLLRV